MSSDRPTTFVQSAQSPIAAAIWMTMAAILFTAMIVCVRVLSETMTAFEIVFFRSFVGMIIMLPVLMRHGLGYMRTKRLPMYGWRILSGYLGMVGFYTAIPHIGMVDATTLNATVPLWAVLLAWIFLKEPVGPRRAGLTLLGFAGALILLRPGFTEISPWALLALGSASVYAITMLVIKSLSRTEPPSRMVMYMNVLFTITSLPMALPGWVNPTLDNLPYVIGVGVFATTGHYCFSTACGKADASVVVPFDFLRLPFIAVAGYLVFTVLPDIWTVIGAMIIFLAVYLLAQTEARRTVAAAAGAALDPAATVSASEQDPAKPR